MSAVRHLLRGVWTAAVPFLLMLALYFGLSLVTVLVVAVDSSGPGTFSTIAHLTWAMMSLSQGIGVILATVPIGVPALLFSVLTIVAISEIAKRREPHSADYTIGLILWVTVTLLIGSRSGLVQLGSFWSRLFSSALVFTLGYCLAAIPRIISERRASWEEKYPRTVAIGRHTLSLLRNIVLVLVALAVIVLLMWIIINHEVMGKVFSMTNMPTGSRIMTTVISLAWLPNILLWALSWLFGAGFVIGDLGTFTLWSGSAHDLPPIPFFGLFPQPITHDDVRFAVLLIPLLVGFALGLFMLLNKRGFHYPAIDATLSKSKLTQIIVIKGVFPLMSFSVVSILLVGVTSAAFAVSNGSLGKKNLAHLGVDVAASTQAVARPVFSGLLLAWVVALVILAVTIIIVRRRATTVPPTHLTSDDLVDISAEHVSHNAPQSRSTEIPPEPTE